MIVQDLKLQVRLLGALLATALGGLMFTDALRVMSEQTVLSKIAQLSTYPQAIAVCLIVAAVLVIPYFLMQTLDVFEEHREAVTRLACRSVLFGGILYAYIGYLSRGLDYKYITGIFIATSLLNLAMAASLAYGINLMQLRALDKLKFPTLEEGTETMAAEKDSAV